MSDDACPVYAERVLIGGNAAEQQRRRDARERLTQRIIDLADDLERPSYEPAPYSVERLTRELDAIRADIETELERREDAE